MKRKLAFSVIVLAVTSGCAKTPPAVDFEKGFLEEKAKYEPNIGKTYWLCKGSYSYVREQRQMSSTAPRFPRVASWNWTVSNGV